MKNLITGDKITITGNEVDFHGFEDGTEVEFLREHSHPIYGYMVRGTNKDGIETTVKILDEHIEQ